MPLLFYSLISAFFVSLLSFIGALALFLKEKTLNKILLLLVAFSAGALLGGAFLHLLPEALSESGGENQAVLKIFILLLCGFCFFYILEEFIKWHHHHSSVHPEAKPFSYLILFSDAVHNFLDGIIIVASFAVSLPVALASVVVIVLHEIPQEIGDFGVLIYGGFKKRKALLLNFLSGLLALLGVLFGFLFVEKLGKAVVLVLSFAAGNFIYIACSDLIPEIKQGLSFKKSLTHFVIFLAGIALMFLMKLFF